MVSKLKVAKLLALKVYQFSVTFHIPIEKGGKHESGRVASPDVVFLYFKISFTYSSQIFFLKTLEGTAKMQTGCSLKRQILKQSVLELYCLPWHF